MQEPDQRQSGVRRSRIVALVVAISTVAGLSVAYSAASDRGFSSMLETFGQPNTTVQPPVLNGATLFDGFDAAHATAMDDPSSYELGTKFVAKSDGMIAGLAYLRAVADADDTDARKLSLWSITGDRLASVESVALPGESGWQNVSLDTPVRIARDQVYVVSYGTQKNYAYTTNFFTQAHLGPGGQLWAPSSAEVQGNGVFSYGAINTFPEASYEAANYWVDVLFLADADTPAPDPTIDSECCLDNIVEVPTPLSLVQNDPDAP